MKPVVKILLEYFGYTMKDINFNWDGLTDEERIIFISKENFEVIKREYKIFKQNNP
jgi:hypothetical protein